MVGNLLLTRTRKSFHVRLAALLKLAFISAFFVLIYHCSSICKRRVDSSAFTCINPNCPSLVSGQVSTIMTLDILTDFSDATGTVTGCFLGGTQAEEMLKCTVNETYL